MKKMLKRLNKREGFTLAELLIVVAIIAVLVAISIPIFNNQLEKAREATDAANIRNAISDVTLQYLSADTPDATGYTATVTLTQKKNGWETAPAFNDSKGNPITVASGTIPNEGGKADVTIASDGSLSIKYYK
ncbi:prepilin-type N-terminal cleavage/methylation domain-containing protein [Butyrivibrio sp. AE3006]|uniref:prepilin-type N-terminal cleavage/methylation domain-containing protein n=1 Tax=Butyrivibrio sp. AE3006 TaxID=1280673 RepID=UPI00040535BE|nr:prepilin-type N-terminal cleavage/methylation domain-containing protein [Butyrivibrio sp. AE3006]